MAFDQYMGWPNAASAATISQIMSNAVDPGVSEIMEAPAGSPDPDQILVSDIRPVINGTTSDVKTALDTLGTGIGLKLTGSSVVGVVFFVKQDPGQTSTIASGSVHKKLTVNKGVIVPRTLSFSRNSPAILTFDMIAIYDGTNAPLVLAGSAALSPASISYINKYFFGGVTINGTTYPGVQSGSIDFGINVRLESDAGKPYATGYQIDQRSPRITLQANDIDAFNDLGVIGAAINNSTKVVVYLGLVANDSVIGASNALKFTMTNGRVRPASLQVNGGGRSWGTTLAVTPRTDNTNAQVIYATGATLP